MNSIAEELKNASITISEVLSRTKERLDSVDVEDEDYSKNKLLVEEFRQHINEQIDLLQI